MRNDRPEDGNGHGIGSGRCGTRTTNRHGRRGRTAGQLTGTARRPTRRRRSELRLEDTEPTELLGAISDSLLVAYSLADKTAIR